MHICRSSWVLVFALWLASPQPCLWAGGSGALQPSAQIQVAGPVGQGGYWQLPRAGWSAAVQASDKDAGLGWGSAFSRRAVLGLALTGSGFFLIKKGFDYRREADALYDRYLDALDPTEISLLYQRTNKRDLKSLFSWTLGAILGVSGAHLLLGDKLSVFHLRLAPPCAEPYFRGGIRGAQVKIFKDL